MQRQEANVVMHSLYM